MGISLDSVDQGIQLRRGNKKLQVGLEIEVNQKKSARLSKYIERK